MLCYLQVYSSMAQLYTDSFFFRFLSHRGYHRSLSRVPCTTQQVLVGLPVLYRAVGVCPSQAPDLSLPCLPVSKRTFVSDIFKSVSVL